MIFGEVLLKRAANQTGLDLFQPESGLVDRAGLIIQWRGELFNSAVMLREIGVQVMTPSSASSRQNLLNVSNMLTPPVLPR